MDTSARSSASMLAPDGGPTAAFAEQVMVLHLPSPPDRRAIQRDGAALQIHRPLVQVARCRGALDLAIGDRLAALTEGDRLLRLGFVSLGDYARERLQLPARRAQALARLSRELESRPLLDRAVRQGEVSARRAQVVLPMAQGQDEARWVELALDRAVTVRALEARVQAAQSVSRSEAALAPEPFRTLKVELSTEQSQLWELALDIAGQVLGPKAPRWQRVQAICEEYLGSYPTERDAQLGERGQRTDRSARVQEVVEQIHHYWQLLGELAPCEPVWARERVLESDPFELDRQLGELGRARAGWDELVGRLGLLMRSLGLWRELGFTSLSHYCREQLGMSARALQQRAWLEERLYALPELRRALRAGEQGYECARLIARVARPGSIDRWLEWARGRTVLAVRRAVERYEQAPLHHRDRAAPWVGSERCAGDRPWSLADLLRPERPLRRAKPTASLLPACSAATGEAQMCALSGEGSPTAQMCALGDEASRAAQMCAPRWGTLRCFEPGEGRPGRGCDKRLRLPESVFELLAVAISVVRERAGRRLAVSECLEVLAAHFAVVWLRNFDTRKRQTLSQRIVARDRGRCTVPGCSRGAEHAHHVRYRSRGGGNEQANLTGECAPHHLVGEHRGFIEVSGRAPAELTWKLGVRAGRRPLLEYRAGRRVK